MKNQHFESSKNSLIMVDISADQFLYDNTENIVAYDKSYRRQGVTRKLMDYFEKRAGELGYKYITLGSKEDAFYEKCGYRIIFEINGQNIYQKVL